MVAIIRAGVKPKDFTLGRILQLPEGMTVNLETYIPCGNQSGLFFSTRSNGTTSPDPVVERAENHPSVTKLEKIEEFPNQTLFVMDWDVESDLLFQGIRACSGQILTVTGTPREWEFSIRFRVHTGVTRFREHCEGRGINFTLLSIYQLSESHGDPNSRLFGMTEAQRETLILAVRSGYFAVPRQCSTADLAEELGISDQAVVERLRRGISNFVKRTFLSDISP